MNNATNIFDAFRALGITPPNNFIKDGEIHRFSTKENVGDKSGWYIFRSGQFESCTFGCWRSGVQTTWHEKGAKNISHQDLKIMQDKIKKNQALFVIEAAKKHSEARQKATQLWAEATFDGVNNNGYLFKKGVKPFGVKVLNDTLVIPLTDGNNLTSLQFVKADGEKKFLSGGQVKGCYFKIGEQKEVVFVCEGYATGASIHEATNECVFVAFNAKNIIEVSKKIRASFPYLKIVIAADDDLNKVGIKSATEAASLTNATVKIPIFGETRPIDATDFNDLHKQLGLKEVKFQLDFEHSNPPNSSAQMADLMSNSEEKLQPSVNLVCAADVMVEPISWIWEGWLARGKLHILAGMAGTGKTTISMALAATVSRGDFLPGGTKSEKGSVLIWTGEDSRSDTLLPRLIAAGADLKKIHFVDDIIINSERRAFDPAIDMLSLLNKAKCISDLSLLIIDPIVNAVSGDSHKNGEVRRALQPVVEFGEKLNCAVLGITHFSKGGQGKNPLERVTGSLAFGALARIVLVAAKVGLGNEDRRVFCRAKSNIGSDSGGFEYNLKQIEVAPSVISSCAQWGQHLEGSALALLGEGDGREKGVENKTALEDAIEFLKQILKDGELSQKQIQHEAVGSGHAWRTVERAKKELKISSKKSILDSSWYWKLSNNNEDDVGVRQDRHINNVAVLAESIKSYGAASQISNYEEF